ncbi:hypothetical protein EJ05DRAFT_363350 [Pseudovirgaria hyperparasitica]|uniref:BHLH domain-containing protein n=1 Tax=Pseudovirgaria hyperparasitica TaxID=470096 RepID=A0A6A6W7Y4_9PEZI|nr:uncharacterized protein EJ05DRAFT_363350 [Pseudovirgaria hyperparasitica]KAF2758753.1 hypothetical protein EJ05DRAFT_363350 [Pseudovirgaria hyperparasitica]
MPQPQPPRPRLTTLQKKANHIASEQKRREAIRKEYDKLAALVPGTEGMGRSEALVLERTIKYMRDQINYRYQMLANAKRMGVDVSKWELDEKVKEGMRRCEEQDVLRAEMEAEDQAAEGKVE